MDFLTYELVAAFLTLTVLEIILGIDNVVFITILTNKLPRAQRNLGRVIGLGAAMIARILLLLSLSWLMGLTETLFAIGGHEVNGRDLILLAGGLFLLWKAVREIHNSLEVEGVRSDTAQGTASFFGTMVQIMLIDFVFSIDSVITAIGLVDQVPVMIAAIVIAIIVMMVAAGPISNFVEDHPPIKMLALCFLVLIGVVLVIEGWGMHVPKAYIYVSMGFAFGVQVLNMLLSGRPRVKLRKAQLGDLYYAALLNPKEKSQEAV